MSTKQTRYTDEFKAQIVALFKSGKSRSEIAREYGLSKTSVSTWINFTEKTGSFKTKENRSEEEKELLALRKELKQLRMENDLLKQAALILARK